MAKHLAAVLVWLLVPITVFAFPRDIPEITCLAILVVPLAGLVLAVTFAVLLLRGKHKRNAAHAVALVLIFGALWFSSGLKWGARLHLLVNRSRYEAIIARLLPASSAERGEICGENCFLLSDEPLRVSFHFCHCFLNWPDIVYDPTGAITDPDIGKLHRLNVYLFGGERLTGDWYLGRFGD
jgi:hypothetical protein